MVLRCAFLIGFIQLAKLPADTAIVVGWISGVKLLVVGCVVIVDNSCRVQCRVVGCVLCGLWGNSGQFL